MSTTTDLRLERDEKVTVRGTSVTVTERAYAALPRLRAHLVVLAEQGGTTTYGALVRDLDLPYRPIGVGRLLDLLSVDCARRGEPDLAALVVSGATGEVGSSFPGDGPAVRDELRRHWRRP